MLNQQIKKMIIDALMKVVDSAPTRSNIQYKLYAEEYPYETNGMCRQGYAVQYEVSNENFQTWINYVFSVLNIAAQHIDSNLSYSICKKIENIVYKNGANNISKTIDICKIILDYAQNIVKM